MSVSSLFSYKHIFCVCFLGCILSGCSGQSDLESATEDYAERLSRVLETDITIQAPAIILTYPEATQRALVIPEKTLKLSEFYAINNCPLALLIAQRNTALGKVESPSRRYVYEMEVLDALSICKEQVEESSLVSAKLDELSSHKMSLLPMVRAKLLHDSEAIRLGTGFSRDFLSINNTKASQGYTETLLALEFLSKLKNVQNISHETLEMHLQALEQHRLLANMWRTQQYISKTLPVITYALYRHSATMECSSKTIEQNKILSNVLNMFFVDKIQAIGSQLNAYHYQFKPLIQALISEIYLAEAVKEYWHTQTHKEFARYQNTIKDHVKAWQNIFTRCQ